MNRKIIAQKLLKLAAILTAKKLSPQEKAAIEKRVEKMLKSVEELGRDCYDIKINLLKDSNYAEHAEHVQKVRELLSQVNKELHPLLWIKEM